MKELLPLYSVDEGEEGRWAGGGEVLRISGGEIRMFIYVLSRSPAQIHLKWFWCRESLLGIGWSGQEMAREGGNSHSHWELRISVG